MNTALERPTFEKFYSPDVVIDRRTLAQGEVFIVRDDLLEGGSKQRAAVPFLKILNKKGFKEFVYASPFAGFAQVALAASCRQLGVKCRLYCEQDPHAARPGTPHAFTQLAKSFGASIQIEESLEDAEIKASRYRSNHSSCFKVSLGFNHPEFKCLFDHELVVQWNKIKNTLNSEPKSVWLTVGSATLGHIFRKVIPSHIQLRCIDVGVLDANDMRIQTLRAKKNVFIIRAPECFADFAAYRPPLPSNIHYDAKVWRFFSKHAEKGDLWWNIAR